MEINDKIFNDVRRASLEASIAITSIANRVNLDPPQRIMMLTTTFTAIYYSLRDYFTKDLEDAVLAKLKYEMSRLDKVDEMMKDKESNLDAEALINDFRKIMGDQKVN